MGKRKELTKEEKEKISILFKLGTISDNSF